MKDFKTLKVWEKAHSLTLRIYEVTQGFPQNERFGLVSQMRRASVSIPANIAEGCGKRGDADLARFLQIALGSASELEYHLLLSRDLKYLPTSDYEILNDKIIEVKRMLSGFIKTLRAGSRKPKADR